jgi:DNA-binding PadR family transcriptional regulator
VLRSRAPSAQAVKVIRALAAEPARWRYGYDLGNEVDLRSGSLYPILVRLADRGWLEATWSQGPAGKPPRHLYRLTALGLEQAANLVDEPVRPRRSLPHPQWRPAQ